MNTVLVSVPSRGRPGGRRLVLASCFALGSLFCPPVPAAAGAVAAPAPPPAPPAVEPRFLIETISIAGVQRQATRAIIVSQSYLKTGQSYTERELQEAVYRIKRLPFVVDAELALRKGSERGRYELVVTVEETRPLFLDYGLSGFYQARTPGLGFPTGRNRLQWENGGTLAVREFVGASGFAFVSVSGGNGPSRTLQLGYTQYGLFGGNSYASLLALTELRSHLGRDLLLEGSAGIPLSSNVMLIASPGWAADDGPGPNQSRDWSGNLSLVYRTTDDPIIPTSGADVELGAFGEWSQGSSEYGGITYRSHATDLSLTNLATDYRPITRRQSVGLSLDVAAGRDTETQSAGAFPRLQSTGEQASLALLYTASLWSGAATRRFGDLRLEGSGGYTVAHTSSAFALYSTAGQLNLGAGLVFRNPWGILRFNLTYLGRVDR